MHTRFLKIFQVIFKHRWPINYSKQSMIVCDINSCARHESRIELKKKHKFRLNIWMSMMNKWIQKYAECQPKEENQNRPTNESFFIVFGTLAQVNCSQCVCVCVSEFIENCVRRTNNSEDDDLSSALCIN